MKWIKIDKDNLPDGEVLAANFKKSSYGYGEKVMGYLSKSKKAVFCENDNTLLENCTHYIDIHKFDIV